MLKIWIHKNIIPEADRVEFFADKNRCVEIEIDNFCKICNFELKLSTIYIGSNMMSSTFANLCSHIHSWNDIYQYRIIKMVAVEDKELAYDGQKCAGRCGNWVPLAAPNQSNGTFICYGCRSSF